MPVAMDSSVLKAPHAEPATRVLAALGSNEEGLGPGEVAARLARWGRNETPQPRGPSAFAMFARQFRSPLIYVLAVAAGVSGWLSEWADATFIGLVLVLNAVIGATQEYRAERSARALHEMLAGHAEVIRDGDVSEVDAAELVAGDVVLLSTGNRVPADLRLLESRNLQVDESSLTGESLPVTKHAQAELPIDTLTADRVTMAHAGTLVTHGRARGVVTATGAHTVLGRLAGQLQMPSQGEPPLLMRMRHFTFVVGVGVAAGAAIMAVIELLRGTAWHEVLLVAVALAVSAIPEGLPVALTVALSVATNRMASRHVIVRRLVAIESLGSCTVIASDKTGTLTMNRLTVGEVAVPGSPPWRVTGTGDQPLGTIIVEGCDQDSGFAATERLARAAVLCNEATLAHEGHDWVHHGDAVDVALLMFGHKLGITRPQALAAQPQLAAVPYEPEHRYAATLHALGGGRAEVVVKGALEKVLTMCTTTAAGADSAPKPLDPAAVTAQAESMAARGQRVLAIAVGSTALPLHDEFDHHHLRHLTLLGLVGMSDPLRPEASAAVAACRDAGVHVLMMTGDHPSTAIAVGRELGIADQPEDVITGAQLRSAEDAGPDAIDALVGRARVFARIEPKQKLLIVESLTRRGEIVGVTGDGANDAPALHHSHVGVAMGLSGTDVAREAAEVVLTDDSFASVAAGVQEGRVAYANIRKVITLLITTGVGELVLVLGALAAGLPLPLLAVQLLWLNLVTNGIQDVALAFEPSEGDEMRRPPRPPDEPIFNRLMVQRIVLSALVIGGITLLTYHWLINQGWSTASARNSAVLLMVLFENVQVFNARSELRSVFTQNPLRNPLLIGGTLLAQLVHIAAMLLPGTQHLLGLEPISLLHWATLLGLALVLLVVIEAHKALWRHVSGRGRS